jgi:hypothetical protein
MNKVFVLLFCILLSGCLVSFAKTDYHGRYFERCMYLDYSKDTTNAVRLHCWKHWLYNHSEGEWYEKCIYARKRIEILTKLVEDE